MRPTQRFRTNVLYSENLMLADATPDSRLAANVRGVDDRNPVHKWLVELPKHLIDSYTLIPILRKLRSVRKIVDMMLVLL